MTPADIKTEVFLLPAALAGEKEGSFTNTHRLLQWHDKVVEAPGDSRSELWFVYHLGKRLKELYAGQHRCDATQPIRHLTWDYPVEGHARGSVGGGRAEGNQRLHVARAQAGERATRS